jgi:3',5'-nucleoside bisphosphate phosphatase
MKNFRADLHIHSVLSPCGDLDMSPSRIIEKAKSQHIDILGMSDHNSTHHCRLMEELGTENGIKILPGVEVNSMEEIHCLAFFENIETTDDFQKYLDDKLPAMKNQPKYFGQQLVVDRNENILREIEVMLTSALEATIYEISNEVYIRKGIFIPSHIDRAYTSIISQLGFIPTDLTFDALEVSARYKVSDYTRLHPELEAYTLITNSDAHVPDAIGRAITLFEMEECTLDEIRMALHKENGRKTRCL